MAGPVCGRRLRPGEVEEPHTEVTEGGAELLADEAVDLGHGLHGVTVGVPVVVGEPGHLGTDTGRVAVGADDGRVDLQGAAGEAKRASAGR